MKAGTEVGGGRRVPRQRCPVFESERGHQLYEGRKRGHRDVGEQRTAEGSRSGATSDMIGCDEWSI